MSYYFARTLALPFDAAVTAVREALSGEGFGVITEIDVQKTMQAKLGEEIRPYLILGACNPRMAFEALKLENKVGTMLPCNVVVQDLGDGRTEVAAIDPEASMAAIPNPGLKTKAAEVGARLKAVLDSLSSPA
jgi:uncharacterized protein (DUF302 family)